MKQSLHLRMTQQLALTPQLQQAIKLLQLSTLDLQQTITEALESNPLLEQTEELHPETDSDSGDDGAPRLDFTDIAPEPHSDQELSVDTQWEDLLPSAAPPTPTASPDEQSWDQDATPESLHDHLMWQLNLTRFSETDHAIALALIDGVDLDGRLVQSPEQILEALAIEDLELDEVMAVLHRLQHFEPTGVFAHDLKDCLLIQLRQMPLNTPFRDTAGALVSRFLEHIPTTEPRHLARRLRVSEEVFYGALELVRSLDPTPGSSFGAIDTQYIIPDVFVRKTERGWRVELNPDIAPKLRVNEQYAALADQQDSGRDRSYFREHLQEARWFIKSLVSRNETLLKVATQIIQHQTQFLEHGEEAMRPLVLADIAAQIDMHESTVSRATTRKYMHTPRGTYELKYFFSSQVANAEGGAWSSTAIKALIKKLVADEAPKKPLSDSKLCDLLKAQGVLVARRTVAKYREQLNIAPSNERKRMI